MDEIREVRELDATGRLPKRLVFEYKSGSSRQWPLQNILNDGFNTMIKMFPKITRSCGFTPTAKTELLKKIEEICRRWH